MNWEEISKQKNLSEQFMKEHKDQLDWRVVSSNPTLTGEFLLEMKEYTVCDIVWKNNENVNEMLQTNENLGVKNTNTLFECISINPYLNKKYLLKYEEFLKWDFLVFNNPYVKNEMKIEEYEQYVDWDSIHIDAKQFNQFNIDFIKKYKEYLNWRKITKELVEDRFEFSIAFIDEMKEYIDWDILLLLKRFPSDILKRYQEYLVWDMISGSQILSEEFMEQFSNQLNWYLISKYQKLSFSFVKKHIHKMHVKNLRTNIGIDFTTEEWKEIEKKKRKKVIQSIWFNFINKEKYKNY